MLLDNLTPETVRALIQEDSNINLKKVKEFAQKYQEGRFAAGSEMQMVVASESMQAFMPSGTAEGDACGYKSLL